MINLYYEVIWAKHKENADEVMHILDIEQSENQLNHQRRCSPCLTYSRPNGVMVNFQIKKNEGIGSTSTARNLHT